MPLPEWLQFARKKPNVIAASERRPMDERLPDGRTVLEAVIQTKNAQDGQATPMSVARTTSAAAPDGRTPVEVGRERQDLPPLARAVGDALDRQTKSASLPQPEASTSSGVPILRPRRATPLTDDAPITVESGVEFDETQSATRPRFADPAGRLEKQITYETENPAKDRNGWWGILKNAGVHALLGLMRGGVPAALVGAATGGIHGAIDKSADEKFEQQRRVGGWQKQLAEMRGREAVALEMEGKRTDIEVKEANRDLLRRRPDLEASKAESASLQRDRQAVFSQLRLLKGTKLSGDHPVLQQAAALGIFISPDEFNNAASNVVSAEVIDPDRPEQKRRVFFNKVTGQITADAGQSGYVQPVGSDGMTEAQRRGDSDRDRAYTNTVRHQLVTERLAADNYRRSLSNDLRGRARDAFNVETKGLVEEARRLHSDLDRWRKRKAEMSVMPATADTQIDSLEARLSEIGAEMDAARERALSSFGVSPSNRTTQGGRSAGAGASASAALGSASSTKGRISRANLSRVREQNPQLKGKSDAEVESALRAEGYEVY